MRATVKAHVPLPDLSRGEVAEVEVTDRVVRRAANGLISILEADGEHPVAPNAGTIDEVVERVGDDPDRARVAWEAEHQRDGGPRVGLVERLEPLLPAEGE